MKRLICSTILVFGLVVCVQGYAATPVALWLFDDGAGDVATDSTGNGYNGTLRGNATWGDGKNGGGMLFSFADGSNVITPVPYLNTLTITMSTTARINAAQRSVQCC